MPNPYVFEEKLGPGRWRSILALEKDVHGEIPIRDGQADAHNDDQVRFGHKVHHDATEQREAGQPDDD